MINKLKILHIDMDAFFASIEQRDNIYLRNLPVIISGDINKRSVVSTCSYEAREYGVRSAMPTKIAYKLCPNGIFIYPRFEYYKSISTQIKNILLGFTDRIEMFSLDEAYLDISNNKLKLNDPIGLSIKIKNEIKNLLGLTCSIGLSFNKFLAKIGSDYKKPDGFTIINDKNFEEIIDSLTVDRIYGIGPVTAVKLKKLGINNGKDLKKLSKEFLFKKFGVRGINIFENIRGMGESEIIMDRLQKSFSKEMTLEHDVEYSDILDIVKKCLSILCNIMKKQKKYCKTITLKIKFSDFTCFSKQVTCRNIITEYSEMMFIMSCLVNYSAYSKKKIRLVGVKISNLIDRNKIKGNQLCFFDLI